MIDLLVTAGVALTVDPHDRVIDDAAIAIDEGVIVGVGTAGEVAGRYRAKETIDVPHGVVLPGLVDAHSHAGHALVRTVADDLDAWMEACAVIYLHGATPDFWEAEARLTAVERLLAGTTTSLSMLGGAGDTIRADDPDHGRAHLAAYAETGLRSVLVVGPGGPPFPKVTTDHRSGEARRVESGLEDQLATVEALAAAATEPLGRVATTFPTLSMDEIGGAGLAAAAGEVARLAERLDLRIVQDGHRGDTVRASAELGLLGSRSLLSHATDLDAADIELIAAAGASIAHNPAAIFSQVGRCPVPELIAAGVAVGLGSDATAPDRSADMFRHMFALTRYHRADRRDPGLFPPAQTLRMATMGSARALGLDASIGSLEVGKAADVVVVDAGKPHLTPLTHPVHQIVYFATGADVDTVIVDGVVRMRRRTIEHVDLEAVMREARRQQELAVERASAAGATVPPLGRSRF